MLHYEYTYAALLVPGCCTFLVPFFQFVYTIIFFFYMTLENLQSHALNIKRSLFPVNAFNGR